MKTENKIRLLRRCDSPCHFGLSKMFSHVADITIAGYSQDLTCLASLIDFS
jgi:hypothetical protein